MQKSDKPIKKDYEVIGKRMYIFSKEYASDFDPETHRAGMLLSIGQKLIFVPCEEPVELDYDTWSLLKNIGRIGRIVGVKKEDNES